MMTTERQRTCFYKHTGQVNIVRSGCEPHREWIPQMDMNFCPFCGNHLKILRIYKQVEDAQIKENPDG